MTKLKVIELFAGIGAQREALKRAGIEHEVVAISEIDKYALIAYELLHGKTPNLGDISKIEKLPKSNMWTYSFPCTDISLAGRLGGFEKGSNTHSSLLWEVQRLLEKFNESGELPRYLIMENVKNLISKKFMPLFQVWIDYLSSLGYKNFYQVLNAKNYILKQTPATDRTNWLELKSPDCKVSSVNGKTGSVVLSTDDVSETGNLYYTEERATANFNGNYKAKSSSELTDGESILHSNDIFILNGGNA